MVQVLIVHAHPEPQSFNGAMTDRAIATLVQLGHQVSVSDLYALEFGPVSSRENFLEVRDPAYLKLQNEEMHASQEGGFAPELEAEIGKIESADFVIFQFPLWWWGLPAIMKGWVDRTFAMGRIYSRGGTLTNGSGLQKKAILSLTTGAPGAFFSVAGPYAPLNDILMPVEQGILRYVGFEVLQHHAVHQPARLSQEEREQELESWADRLREISASILEG